MVRIPQSKNIYKSFSPDHVDHPVGCIQKDLIRISNDRQFANDLSGICIEDHQPSRHTAAKKSLLSSSSR
jgi:hypothetical protein